MSDSRMGGVLRRAIGTLLALVLVAAAVGFYLGSPRLSATSGPTPVATAEPVPLESPMESASPDPNPTPTPTPTRRPTPTPDSSPHRDLPPGPGGREPGIRLTATTTPQGAFEMVETVRLAEPVTQLILAPPDLRPAGGHLQTKRPVAEALEVVAGGKKIKLTNTTVRRALVVHNPRPTDLFKLRYRLRGVTVSNTPSSSGRALGGVGPLVTGVPDELPVAVTVRGDSVRNLSCPCLPLDDQACAAGPAPKVRVNQNLRRKDALVVVQFDLGVAGVGGPR